MRADWLACAGRGRSDARAAELLAGLAPVLLELFNHDWDFWARDDQLAPEGDWLTWLILGGRGSGKTRAGSEWVRTLALGTPEKPGPQAGRIALVGDTFADVREVMIEGDSGLLAVHGNAERPEWFPSRRRLEWPNGVIAHAFSSDDPEALRGPQFDAAWSDELAKWRYAERAWDMLQFALRLGERPRQVVTTTPRPIPLVKQLLASPGTVVSRAATRENLANLAPGFLERVVGRYKGSRLGRQELDGELIEDRPDALWRREMFDAGRVERPPDLGRIVVAIDPPASSGARADACGIVVAGRAADGAAYVLQDASEQGLRPAQWASRAIELFHRFAADSLVAEVNQGGEMVTQVLREVDATIPVLAVRATRGKWIRAEPVAALYEQGRVRHVGALPKLEDEMCDFGVEGRAKGRSPDRVDALVWALTALMLDTSGAPRLRSF